MGNNTRAQSAIIESSYLNTLVDEFEQNNRVSIIERILNLKITMTMIFFREVIKGMNYNKF